MTIDQVRQSFVEYYKALGYRSHLPDSLIPSNDPSVLFTTAGMQQFRDYYLYPNLAPSSKLVTVQAVVRTSDIEEVGDDTHLTHFEMLGNFIFGRTDQAEIKKQAITEAWDYLTKILKIEPQRLTATIFGGEKDIDADEISAQIWQEIGVPVKQFGKDENFWGPTGKEGPCGPTSEICLDGIEIWNLVFNQYYQDPDGSLRDLEYFGLDTGSGLERLTATLNRQKSVWLIEPFSLWLKMIPLELNALGQRKVIDHLKAAAFLISHNIKPANKGREYILRRLIRTVAYYLPQSLPKIKPIIGEIVRYHQQVGYQMSSDKEIYLVIEEEARKFQSHLKKALDYLEKSLKHCQKKNPKQLSRLAFQMYESFGLPKEMIFEYFQEHNYSLDPGHFQELFRQHQATSRRGLDKQFIGGLSDHQQQTIKHHTAHHLLLAALRQVLGSSVTQKGSNITSERLRLDFNYDRKLTAQELQKIEDLVNSVISKNLPVEKEQMSKEQALKSGALAEFGQKYQDMVWVYSIGDFSKEVCGGPHVKNTGALGQFKILKEEASSQGVRRIKARLL